MPILFFLKFGILFFNSKKIVIKKFPLNEIHFFPIVPLPFVCMLEQTIPAGIFLDLIFLIASSFVLFTLQNLINLSFIKKLQFLKLYHLKMMGREKMKLVKCNL